MNCYTEGCENTPTVHVEAAVPKDFCKYCYNKLLRARDNIINESDPLSIPRSGRLRAFEEWAIKNDPGALKLTPNYLD